MPAAAVYRIYDAENVLLYVGMGINPLVRLHSHSERPWWGKVARVSVEWCSDPREAGESERRAIETESPVHNVKHVVRVLPNPTPVVVGEDEVASLTRIDVARRLGVNESVVIRCIRRGWIVGSFRIPLGGHRGRVLYSERAVEEFKRRWEAGEYDTTSPPRAAE